MVTEEKRQKRAIYRWNKNHPGIPWPGYQVSLEIRQKKSQDNSGENNPMFGKHHTEESKEKIIKNHRGMAGKHHTEESKEKMRKAYYARMKVI